MSQNNKTQECRKVNILGEIFEPSIQHRILLFNDILINMNKRLIHIRFF